MSNHYNKQGVNYDKDSSIVIPGGTFSCLYVFNSMDFCGGNDKMKLVLEATMVLALLVGGYTYLTQKENKESNDLKETIIDQDAYIHELQAQIARNDAIINVMEDGATLKQAKLVVDSASAYGVELK